ncbi:gamma carbonic anhydrase family protein [Mesorhizobium sp. B2-4-6]|uniref:gamma carbonic anhydrase family protein n=1 Tax=Mesorhizobium sp. B2-4-6 TaxID=2589943 RepID=UPI001128C4A3|nr:gamma carbonic anhydrase family protein [Mesorhizobium sp. B2-4-6]TPL43546.1 gamma carbonic anhydrase family protein [Mesorhizobium sp. B2-4-6]
MSRYTLDGHRPVQPPDGDCWIAPGAHVVGKVRLAEGTSIWFGAVLRGDNEVIAVGARSNIQDGAILHTDPGFPLTIGPDCTVGHRTILHGCAIGAGSLIGMGAIVMNGAVIGEGSLVGAGALVTEGKQFPPRSLILGAPARLAKVLSAEEADRLKAPAQRYVANGRRYRDGLRALADAAASAASQHDGVDP